MDYSNHIRTGEAARILCVTPQTVKKWARDGKLPHEIHPLTGQMFFEREDIEAYLEKARNK